MPAVAAATGPSADEIEQQAWDDALKSNTRPAFEAYLKCYEKGVLVRQTGDTIALAPALIIEEAQIDEIVGTLRSVLETLD